MALEKQCGKPGLDSSMKMTGNGRAAKSNEFPPFVFIAMKYNEDGKVRTNSSGGTILIKYLILSAAYCVYGRKVDEVNVSPSMNTTYTNINTRDELKVHRISIPSNYIHTNNSNAKYTAHKHFAGCSSEKRGQIKI